MKRSARFATMLLALVGITWLLLSLVFETPAERRALRLSAGLAIAVQMTAFALLRWAGETHALVGWGLGALLRLTALVVYGFFFARVLQLPLSAALVAFAVFLFVSMLLESLLLAYDR